MYKRTLSEIHNFSIDVLSITLSRQNYVLFYSFQETARQQDDVAKMDLIDP